MENVASQVSADELARQTRECGSLQALVKVSGRLPELQVALVTAGAAFRQVGEAVSAVTDAITRRLLELAERDVGVPPAAYTWLACGSQARREQAVVSDQDNALMFADERSPAEHDAYFAALTRFVNDGLAECGFPHCRGGVMASNPAWRQPLSGWQAHFDGWIGRPTTHALMHATIFFDMRAVVGDDGPLRRLQEHVLERVRGNHIFLKLMVANAIDVRPPLGIFGGLAAIGQGEHAGTIDVKKGGIMPIVDIARVHALAAGSTALGTIDRLRDAAARRVLSAAGAGELADAFELSASIRASHQVRQLQRGVPPDNYLRPDELTEYELRRLKRAYRIIRRHQHVLERRNA
jgi:CBS domain-containing protein